jgi:hypothetical protein
MKRLEDGSYEIFIREDYLQSLNKVRGGLDRDSCIQEAMEQYLALPEGKRHEETQRQDVRISWPEGTDPRHYMLRKQVSLSGDVIGKIKPIDNYTDQSVNAAIRLWLQSKGIEDLRQ